MPHVHIYRDPKLVPNEWIKMHSVAIRLAVALALGYNPDEVATLVRDHHSLDTNMLDFELRIDSGKKRIFELEAVGNALKGALPKLPDLVKSAGLWIISHTHNYFSEFE